MAKLAKNVSRFDTANALLWMPTCILLDKLRQLNELHALVFWMDPLNNWNFESSKLLA